MLKKNNSRGKNWNFYHSKRIVSRCKSDKILCLYVYFTFPLHCVTKGERYLTYDKAMNETVLLARRATSNFRHSLRETALLCAASIIAYWLQEHLKQSTIKVWMLKETLKAAEQIRRRAVFKVFIRTDVSFRLALKIQTFARKL